MSARLAVAAGTPYEQLPELLSPGDVAAVFGVDAKTVTRWARTGKLAPAITTPGGHRRYRRGDLLPFLVRGAQ